MVLKLIALVSLSWLLGSTLRLKTILGHASLMVSGCCCSTLNFPGFSIGEGPDNILQSGDTLLFNIIEDTPMAGSGTLDCWRTALEEGSFFDECVVLTVWQINDSGCIDGSCEGLGGFRIQTRI